MIKKYFFNPPIIKKVKKIKNYKKNEILFLSSSKKIKYTEKKFYYKNKICHVDLLFLRIIYLKNLLIFYNY